MAVRRVSGSGLEDVRVWRVDSFSIFGNIVRSLVRQGVSLSELPLVIVRGAVVEFVQVSVAEVCCSQMQLRVNWRRSERGEIWP